MRQFVLLMLLASLAPTAARADAAAGDGAATLVLKNARVYSLRWGDPAPDGAPADDAPRAAQGWRPDAEAVAIRGGEILYVGDNATALGLAGADTRVVDVDGATVLPGLVDSHTHVFGLGARLDQVDLVGVETEAEAVARVEARAKTTPPGEWIVGRGWDDGAWADRYPDKTLLTERVPDHPVYMESLHGFAGWANQAALDIAGIDADTEVPVGGTMQLGPDGEPSGLFLNRAVTLLRDALPPASTQTLTRHALLGLRQMAEDGYTAVHDAGLDSAQMAVLETLAAEDRLPIRVYAMLSLRDAPLIRRWLERGPETDPDDRLVTRTVKAYYDGALGSRGARLLDDYADQPGHRGVSGDDYGFDEALMAAAMKAGFQIAIHAIGDAGNREAMDLLEATFREAPETRRNRHRIEHAQVLAPEDLPRIAALDLIASMEPPHAVEDKGWAEARLGPKRILGAYAWRSLRENGTHLTFNSDLPGSDHDIFYGLHAAVTRKDRDGEPEGGWYPEQRVSIDEAVRAYTSWSAYAAFQERSAGVIGPGRWADLTVLDIDPFAIAENRPGALLAGNTVMTIVAGEIVHAR